MKLGEYKISRSDPKRIRVLKNKLKHIEKSIFSCWQNGFNTKKLMSARSYYIEQIKKLS